MNIEVEYKNAAGTISSLPVILPRLAFVKHLAIAGQGYAPQLKKLMRTLGMFLHYSYYFQRYPFNIDRFSEPPIQLSDPTEKGQFSNLAGKAIADFLSKRIDSSIYTVNYEAALRVMGRPVVGSRPDLLAYRNNYTAFAIEAKGYSGRAGNMVNHKNQAMSGGIPVYFSVACVTYNLYRRVRCKYYDPINSRMQFDSDLFRRLTMMYYAGLSEFLNEDLFKLDETEIYGERFYEVGLSFDRFAKMYPNEFPLSRFWSFKIFDVLRPRLILPFKIREYAENGLTNEISPFSFDNLKEEETIYVDNDRVGLRIR
jgi:hypothetical protein